MHRSPMLARSRGRSARSVDSRRYRPGV